MSERIDEIESRIAFMDETIIELRDSVDAHQQQILMLERRCAVLADRLKAALDAAPGDSEGEDERPPHY